ncbi:MAG: enoyl-CoA hydratase/isomerase family protein [Acidimicrobiales bacterium]|jgi:enoyl-CoA hydratase/carnithine racemase|nr:enoyl-CoA hydratase/isomerase family protein [Acidimicrobiales bacterium]
MVDRAAPRLLGAAEAAVALRLAADDVGVLGGSAMVAVGFGDTADDAAALGALAAEIPFAAAVVVGVPTGSTLPPPAVAFDVVLAGEPPGGNGADRSSVAVADVDAALVELRSGIARSPAASVALVQLLRAGQHLSLVDAVLAESFVYSMLQSGPDHRAWLAGRDAALPRAGGGPLVRGGRHGSRLDVALTRPEARNAVSARLRDDLHAALDVALADPTVAEVHLWGVGPSFCSGGDLHEFGSAPDPVTAHLVRSTRSPALDLVRCSPRLVAHVHGAAVGAGMEWAAFAHRVEARDDAVFRLPEVGMGLVPGAGGTASVPRRIGRQRTAWVALTGATIDAATALDWGLVDEVVTPDDFAASADQPSLRWTDTA